MMMVNKIEKYLIILKLEGKCLEELSIRDVIRAYKMLVKNVHPDTSGYASKEDFQELSEAYESILKLVVKRIKTTRDTDMKRNEEDKEEDEETEEDFVRDNFHNFNFPTEKEGSFVIKVENNLSDVWDECFKNIYGEPKVNCTKTGTETSRLWRIAYQECELTIHFYKKPKTTKVSKFLVQGGNYMTKYNFVFTELPLIYKQVCESKPEKIEGETNENKPSTVTCDKCKFKSTSMIQMKKHLKMIHNPNRSKSTKRLAHFTPASKPSKISKNFESSISNHVFNSEGIVDESMLDDTFKGIQITLEEDTTNDKKKEIILNQVEQQVIYSCSKCDFESESDDVLNKHQEIHTQTQCSCLFSDEEDTVLKVHNIQCKSLSTNRSSENISKTEDADDIKEKESIIICGTCAEGFEDMNDFNQHMEQHREFMQFECEVCSEKFQIEHQLKKHINNNHSEIREEPTVNCNEKSRQPRLFKNHDKTQHGASKSANCSLCNLTYEDTKALANHIWEEHSDNIEIIQCPHCEFQSDMKTMDIHIENDHVELALLGHISENQTILSRNFETFKKELIIPLNKIIESHNSMSQDLVTLRQNKIDSEDRIEKLEKTIEDLKTFLGEKITTKISSRLMEPKVPQPIVKHAQDMSVKKKTKYLKKPKVLFIGDSIAHTASLRMVEKDTNTRVKTVKAYSAVEDLKSRFPSQNFTDVTPAALNNTREDDKYTELVLGAPSVDITNAN